MNLLLIGAPGSGKGTQGARLARTLGLDHVAAGDLLRAEVEAGTDLGKQVVSYLEKGELVSDDIIFELVMPAVLAGSNGRGFILDGFPRTLVQAVEARRFAEREDAHLDAVIFLKVPRDELIRRIMNRAREEGRADDTEEVVANRLQVFDEATLPLIDFYRSRGLLYEIDATGSEDEVTAAILTALGAGGPGRTGPSERESAG